MSVTTTPDPLLGAFRSVMRRIHCFYLTVLCSLLLVGGYRQCQWSGATAESVYPGAILALQRGHKSQLWEMQQGALDYPSPQADRAARQALLLDSLFQQFDTAAVSPAARATQAIWRDSVQKVISAYPDEVDRWLAIDNTLKAHLPVWQRAKNHLLQERADRFLASRIQGTSIRCWFGFNLLVFPAENLVLEGDTLHAEVGELRFPQGNEKIWVNGQHLVGQDNGVDSVFTTPGWHTFDVRVVTPLPYGMRHEARREFKLYVLNHSK